MARIYKRSDRVTIKIDDVLIKVAPLSLDQKAEVQQAMLLGKSKGNIREATRAMSLAVKYGVKSMEGLVDSDNKPYELQFDGENLSDECVEDLFNLEITDKLVMVCINLVNKVPNDFTDAQGNKLEGVELVKTKTSETSSPN
jgi:hypothetical protein